MFLEKRLFLSPKQSREKYEQSISDLNSVLDACGDDHIILSADAQDGVSYQADEDDYLGTVGAQVDGRCGWKGIEFRRLACDFKLRLLNTWHDPLGTCACPYYLRAEPAKIDFAGSNLPSRAVQHCGKLESDATPTDHWPLLVSVA